MRRDRTERHAFAYSPITRRVHVRYRIPKPSGKALRAVAFTAIAIVGVRFAPTSTISIEVAAKPPLSNGCGYEYVSRTMLYGGIVPGTRFKKPLDGVPASDFVRVAKSCQARENVVASAAGGNIVVSQASGTTFTVTQSGSASGFTATAEQPPATPTPSTTIPITGANGATGSTIVVSSNNETPITIAGNVKAASGAFGSR